MIAVTINRADILNSYARFECKHRASSRSFPMLVPTGALYIMMRCYKSSALNFHSSPKCVQTMHPEQIQRTPKEHSENNQKAYGKHSENGTEQNSTERNRIELNRTDEKTNPKRAQ